MTDEVLSTAPDEGVACDDNIALRGPCAAARPCPALRAALARRPETRDGVSAGRYYASTGGFHELAKDRNLSDQ